MPTATQSVELTHDTLLSLLGNPGLGLGTTDQADPFQDSVKVAESPVPPLPTAMQKVVLVHDTLWRSRPLVVAAAAVPGPPITGTAMAAVRATTPMIDRILRAGWTN